MTDSPIVLVTGATGGLGSAVVEQLRSEERSVITVARSHADIEADLTDPAACARVAQTTGSVYALIHLMGGFASDGMLADTTPETWDRMMNVNLRAAFLTFRAVLPGMLARGRGRLIAVGSRAGTEPVSGLSAYGVSKAGLVHLIRTIAAEVAGTDITANIVMPSTIDTEANRKAMPKAVFTNWVSPTSIAKVVSWLASDAASDVSGAVLPVYGKS